MPSLRELEDLKARTSSEGYERGFRLLLMRCHGFIPALLDACPGLDEYEIAEWLGLGLHETCYLIDDLVSRGLVRRVPSGEGDG
jgi:hypothetical protein